MPIYVVCGPPPFLLVCGFAAFIFALGYWAGRYDQRKGY